MSGHVAVSLLMASVLFCLFISTAIQNFVEINGVTLSAQLIQKIALK